LGVSILAIGATYLALLEFKTERKMFILSSIGLKCVA